MLTFKMWAKVLVLLLFQFVTMGYICNTVTYAADPEIARIGWNAGAVANQPVAPSTFSLNSSYRISQIMTYHYNGGSGSMLGTIGLRGNDGSMYGPWQAVSDKGQSGLSTTLWYVFPNVVLPAGSYTVVDSNPATWSQNAAGGGRGFAIVFGSVAASPQAASPSAGSTANYLSILSGTWHDSGTGFYASLSLNGNQIGGSAVFNSVYGYQPLHYTISGQIIDAGSNAIQFTMVEKETGKSWLYKGKVGEDVITDVVGGKHPYWVITGSFEGASNSNKFRWEREKK